MFDWLSHTVLEIQVNLKQEQKNDASAVCLDQRTGALNTIGWQKSSFSGFRHLFLSKNARIRWKIQEKGGLPVFKFYSQMLGNTQKLVHSVGKQNFSRFCIFIQLFQCKTFLLNKAEMFTSQQVFYFFGGKDVETLKRYFQPENSV